MKIRSIQLRQIGVFEDETIEFPEKTMHDKAEIHILTGQNGTGKTTVLQGLASGISGAIEFDFPTKSHINLIKKFVKEDSFTALAFDNGDYTSTQKHSKSFANNNGYSETVAFAYSGYRFIEHQENILIIESKRYNPLKLALEFNKGHESSGNSLNEWLAINSSKRALARENDDKEGVERFDRNIKNVENIIQQITGDDIKFEISYDTGLKVIANISGKKLDFDLLPDGLRSLISWIGDLLMRMDALKWENDLPVQEREFILLLDEIEVHLHPSWQRKILPVVQKFFKNAQIFITTHSPFIVNSVDGAWIHKLTPTSSGVKAEPPILSENGNSIASVLKDIFDIQEEFGLEPQNKLKEFEGLRDEILKGGGEKTGRFLQLGRELSQESLELNTIVQFELRQLNRILDKNLDYAEV